MRAPGQPGFEEGSIFDVKL